MYCVCNKTFIIIITIILSFVIGICLVECSALVCLWALLSLLYNTLFSREDIFAKSEFEIFSREVIFANILFSRKYLPRNFFLAKISSRENNIFPRIVS